MFRTNFSGPNKIWGLQKIQGCTAPECLPVATGLDNSLHIPTTSMLSFHFSAKEVVWKRSLLRNSFLATSALGYVKEDQVTILPCKYKHFISLKNAEVRVQPPLLSKLEQNELENVRMLSTILKNIWRQLYNVNFSMHLRSGTFFQVHQYHAGQRSNLHFCVVAGLGMSVKRFSVNFACSLDAHCREKTFTIKVYNSSKHA